jgi:hypothetical protein
VNFADEYEIEGDCPVEVASGLGWDPLGGICGQFGLDPRVEVKDVVTSVALATVYHVVYCVFCVSCVISGRCFGTLAKDGNSHSHRDGRDQARPSEALRASLERLRSRPFTAVVSVRIRHVSPSRALGFAEARDGSRGLILHPRIAAGEHKIRIL